MGRAFLVSLLQPILVGCCGPALNLAMAKFSITAEASKLLPLAAGTAFWCSSPPTPQPHGVVYESIQALSFVFASGAKKCLFSFEFIIYCITIF